MKKCILLLLLVSISSTFAFSQARKIPLFEHFTQASCGPCAAQNPGFESGIMTPNKGNFNHIAYHTSWPGTDPMNAANPTDVANRVGVYNVTGVPTIQMMGSRWTGSPSGVTQGLIDNMAAETSPVRILVKDTGTTSRNAEIRIQSLGSIPSGTWKLFVAVVENPKNYTSAPGSNGETHFPNVFRDFASAVTGDAFTAAAVGSEVVVNYPYTIDATWVEPNVYVIAWLQNTTTKEVIQSGSSKISNFELINSSTTSASQGTPSTITSFDASMLNLGNANGNYELSFAKAINSDWDANFEIDGTAYTTAQSVTISASSLKSAKVNIMPCWSAGVGKVSLILKSLDDATLAPQRLDYYVVSNVQELLLNNNASQGDGATVTAESWASTYEDAMNTTGATCKSSTDQFTFIKLQRAGALSNVKSVYFNIGWTFPALTDDLVVELSAFLSSGTGKSMLIMGQDVAWDNFDTASGAANGTANTKAFLETYFHIGFVDDGSSTETTLTPVTGDPITGSLSSMTIVPYYTTTNYYPDQISAVAPAEAMLYYNAGTKVAGVRYDGGTYRTAFVPIGLEMLNTADGAALLTSVRNWFFNGNTPSTCSDPGTTCTIVGIQESEPKISIHNIYPNPTDGWASILVNTEFNGNWNLIVQDVTGRVILSEPVTAGATHHINTQDWSTGTYFYSFSDGTLTTETKKLQIIR